MGEEQAVLDHQDALGRIAGMKNKTGEPLYSRVAYATDNADTEVNYFDAETDKTLGNIGGKSRELPVGHLMVVEEIRVALDSDAVVADILEFLKRAVLKFAPNEDARPRYFPLEMLGAGGGPSTPTTTVGSIGVPHQLAAFRLPVPEVIVGGVPFVCSIIHNVACTPSAANKATVTFVGKRAYDAGKAAS